VKAIETKIRTW